MQFPNKVSYFEGAEDLSGDKEKGLPRVKNGQMVVVYKTDDPHWWLGKVNWATLCGEEARWELGVVLQHCCCFGTKKKALARCVER